MMLCVRSDGVFWMCVLMFFFFFKQKTAYEMRISDWSSDVCSSDLNGSRVFTNAKSPIKGVVHPTQVSHQAYVRLGGTSSQSVIKQIGRASCRERVCQYV